MRSTSARSSLRNSCPGTGCTISATDAARRRSCGGILTSRAEPEAKNSSLRTDAFTRSRQRTGTPAPESVTLRSNPSPFSATTSAEIRRAEASPQSIASDEESANLRRAPIQCGISSSTNAPIASRSRSRRRVSESPLSPPLIRSKPKLISSLITAASPSASRRQ